MAKVLVVGGAGYVGSATCALLLDRGHRVTVLDDLSTGHRELALGDSLVVGQAGDDSIVGPLLKDGGFDCVMHFAARSIVPESFQKPDEYRYNNVTQTRALLEQMRRAGVTRFIFSSTCAVYSDPGGKDLTEGSALGPVSPYGQTKLEAEGVLQEASAKNGLSAVALRYFNAAGAEPKIRVGEWHENETHLIPRVLKAVRAGDPVQVFGTDYPTPDGTCVRDYVHVTDLAHAHVAAVDRLTKTREGRFEVYNLGTGKGTSVLEILEACGNLLGKPVARDVKPRRNGDAARLVARAELAGKELGFSPRMGIERILETALAWEEKLEGLKAAKGRP